MLVIASDEYKENGCIDFSKVPYEKTLDKLLELVNAEGFEHFKYDSRLKEAGYLMARSNTDGLEINEELERKASSLLLRASESVLLSTGASTEFERGGLYDLAGNVYEWTLEYTSYTYNPCAGRGGYYNGIGDSSPASSRGYFTSNASRILGFRVSLY